MALGFSAPQFELYFLLLLFLIFSLKQFGFPYVPRKAGGLSSPTSDSPVGKMSCFLLTSARQLQRWALVGLAWIICPPLGVWGYRIDSPTL